MYPMKSPFLYECGHATVVLRPKFPDRSLAASEKLLTLPKEEAERALKDFLNVQIAEGNPYQFIGYASRGGNPRILDEFGRPVDTLRPGDSMAAGPSFKPPVDPWRRSN